MEGAAAHQLADEMKTLRNALVVIGLVVAALTVRQLVIAVNDFGMWRGTMNDPSLRAFYFSSLEIDIALVVFYLFFAWVILYVLRRPQRKTSDVL